MTHPNILLLGVFAYLYICVLYLAIFEYVVIFYEFIIIEMIEAMPPPEDPSG
jgi:hypothetical protein